MKKLMWVLFLIGVVAGLQAQSFQGAIATTDFVTGLTVTMPDGATPVPDGTLCQIMLPGVDGIIDPANPDGTPGGDDQLCDGFPGNNYYEFLWDSSWTGMPGQLYTPTAFLWNTAGQGMEPTANVGDEIYLRLFNAPDIISATHYVNSALYVLPGTFADLYFNTPAHWDYGVNFNWQELEPPTPVTLSDFSYAVFANQFVQISWTTQSSVNMSMWNLYRDNEIIHSEAAVNGTEPYNYIFQDTEVTPGETYIYYLEAIDYDGTSTTFDAMEVQMTGEIVEPAPTATMLKGNYPNPFNPVTTIKFDVKEGETAKLTIFDVKGRVIETASYGTGYQEHVWEANTSASGVYFYKLESSSHTSVRKMLLLK